MPDIDLGKKVGPFPLGAWLALGGAGVGIGLYLRARKAESGGASSGEETEDTTPAVAGGYAGVGVGPPALTYQQSSGTESSAPGGYATNEEWARAALTRGVAKGYTPTVVNSALQKWLYNQGTLTVQESAIINILVTEIGPPPVTPSATDVTPLPTPGPTPNPAPVPQKYVRLRLAPTNLNVVGRTSSTITLRVSSVPGATQYRWFMNGRSGYVTTTTPSVTIKALRSKREYAFQVQAWNPLGPSPRSASKHGTTL